MERKSGIPSPYYVYCIHTSLGDVSWKKDNLLRLQYYMETTTLTTISLRPLSPCNALCHNHGLCIDCIKVALFFPHRLSTELPPHIHTQTHKHWVPCVSLPWVAGCLWQPKGNKNNNFSRPCQSQSIWMPLDGGWISMHKLVVSNLCIRKFIISKDLKSSSTDLENNLQWSTPPVWKQPIKPRSNVVSPLNNVFVEWYHVSLEIFHSLIQMDRSLLGSGHRQIPAF